MSVLRPEAEKVAIPHRKILFLTVTAAWFDLIAANVKKEEYRVIKPYWEKRLFRPCAPLVGLPGARTLEAREFDIIRFTNGYSKDSRWLEIECKGINAGQAQRREWGAPKGNCFIISLGRILAKNF